MKLQQAITNLDATLAKVQAAQKSQGETFAAALEKIQKQTEKPEKTTSKSLAEGLELIGKGLDLTKKLLSLIDGKSKMSTTVINNVAGMAMELVTQSSPELHSGVSGKFVTAPDPFIPPAGSTSMISQKRGGSWFSGNVNGVIYHAKANGKGYHIIVAWSSPYYGNEHYFLRVEEDDKGCVSRNFLDALKKSNHTAWLYSPERGKRLEDIEIEAVGTFAEGNLRVTIQPRSEA